MGQSTSSHGPSLFNPSSSLSNQPTQIIAPATSQVELEERISLFWTIFVLDRYASLICGTSPSLHDETIWTSWPRDPSEWELVRVFFLLWLFGLRLLFYFFMLLGSNLQIPAGRPVYSLLRLSLEFFSSRSLRLARKCNTQCFLLHLRPSSPFWITRAPEPLIAAGHLSRGTTFHFVQCLHSYCSDPPMLQKLQLQVPISKRVRIVPFYFWASRSPVLCPPDPR